MRIRARDAQQVLVFARVDLDATVEAMVMKRQSVPFFNSFLIHENSRE